MPVFAYVCHQRRFASRNRSARPPHCRADYKHRAVSYCGSSHCLSCTVTLPLSKALSMCVQPESRLMSCGPSPRQNCRPRCACHSTLNSSPQVSKGIQHYTTFIQAMSAHLVFRVLTAIFILQLKDLKQELGALRVAKVTGGAPNKLSKM